MLKIWSNFRARNGRIQHSTGPTAACRGSSLPKYGSVRKTHDPHQREHAVKQLFKSKRL